LRAEVPKLSASVAGSKVIRPLPAHPSSLADQNAPLLSLGKIIILKLPMGLTSAFTTMLGTLAQCNPLATTESTPALCAVMLATVPWVAPKTSLMNILYIHMTPYIPSAWHTALSSANLLSTFPNLVHDITFRSPINNPPDLSACPLPPNLTSAKIHPKLIDNELLSKVLTNHMSGPFTVEEAWVIFGGPFLSSPVSLVEKSP